MAPYEITVDQARGFVRAKLASFWDVATTQAYLSALAGAARQVGRNGDRSWWLIDLSDYTVQSRDVAALMTSRLQTIIPASATVAVVKKRGLSALQAKRVVVDDTHIYFDTTDAAEQWLTAEGRPL